jgi:hypothetical protein
MAVRAMKYHSQQCIFVNKIIVKICNEMSVSKEILSCFLLIPWGLARPVSEITCPACGTAEAMRLEKSFPLGAKGPLVCECTTDDPAGFKVVIKDVLRAARQSEAL